MVIAVYVPIFDMMTRSGPALRATNETGAGQTSGQRRFVRWVGRVYGRGFGSSHQGPGIPPHWPPPQFGFGTGKALPRLMQHAPGGRAVS